MAFTSINDSIINTHINNNSSCNLSIALKISGKGLRDTSNASNIYDNNGIGLQLWNNTSNNRELAIIDTLNATNSNYATLRLGITQSGATIRSITSNNIIRPLVINDFLTITSNRVGIGTANPLNGLDVRGNITLDGNLLRSDGSLFTNSQWSNSTINSNNIYYNLGNIGIGTTNPIAALDIRNGNVILDNNSRIGIGLTNPQYAIDINNGNVNIGGNLLISLNNTTNNFNIYTASSNSITFSSNITADILLVGAGGNGGNGTFSGGGGAGEVIYYPNYLFTSGTYSFIVGSNVANTSNRITRITFNNNDIIRALGGGDGGGLQIITANTTITLTQNTNIKYNYNQAIVINGGTYNITFADGAITFSGLTPDNSYPILKDTNGNDINPTAWYKFDNSDNLGLDTMGSFSMTNNNATTDTFRAKGTFSASFNGSTSYIIGTGVNLDNKSYSISWWSYATNLNDVGIYSRYDTSTYPVRGTLHIVYRSSTVFSFAFFADDFDINIITSEHLNKWVFFTLTFDTGNNNRKNIYINGTLRASANAGGALSSPNQNYNIGRGYGDGNYFPGKIDDFRIYASRVLTDAQITELYRGRAEIYTYQQLGASAGIPNNENFSLITSGNAGSATKGGDGGSALPTGRFITTITGSPLSVGLGGTGATVTSTAVNGINYGDGGSGNGGLGALGVIIMRFPTTASKYLTITNNFTEMSNLQISGNIYTSNFMIIDNNWIKSANNIYYNQGNIGVGLLRPSFKLDIIDDINVVGNYYRNGTILSYSGSGTVIYSDSRIKTNIIDINDDSALQQILKIEPKIYNYIDINERGTDTVYGFIAQQIREVIPQAVKIQKDFIPNIYKYYDCINYNQIITNEDLTAILKIGDRIKIKDNHQDFYRTATIITITETKITVDLTIHGDKCFIYGKEINDFHYLDKNYIYTLGVCATQDLYKTLNRLNDKYNEQQMKIKKLLQQ